MLRRRRGQELLGVTPSCAVPSSSSGCNQAEPPAFCRDSRRRGAGTGGAFYVGPQQQQNTLAVGRQVGDGELDPTIAWLVGKLARKKWVLLYDSLKATFTLQAEGIAREVVFEAMAAAADAAARDAVGASKADRGGGDAQERRRGAATAELEGLRSCVAAWEAYKDWCEEVSDSMWWTRSGGIGLVRVARLRCPNIFVYFAAMLLRARKGLCDSDTKVAPERVCSNKDFVPHGPRRSDTTGDLGAKKPCRAKFARGVAENVIVRHIVSKYPVVTMRCCPAWSAHQSYTKVDMYCELLNEQISGERYRTAGAGCGRGDNTPYIRDTALLSFRHSFALNVQVKAQESERGCSMLFWNRCFLRPKAGCLFSIFVFFWRCAFSLFSRVLAYGKCKGHKRAHSCDVLVEFEKVYDAVCFPVFCALGMSVLLWARFLVFVYGS